MARTPKKMDSERIFCLRLGAFLIGISCLIFVLEVSRHNTGLEIAAFCFLGVGLAVILVGTVFPNDASRHEVEYDKNGLLFKLGGGAACAMLFSGGLLGLYYNKPRFDVELKIHENIIVMTSDFKDASGEVIVRKNGKQIESRKIGRSFDVSDLDGAQLNLFINEQNNTFGVGVNGHTLNSAKLIINSSEREWVALGEDFEPVKIEIGLESGASSQTNKILLSQQGISLLDWNSLNAERRGNNLIIKNHLRSIAQLDINTILPFYIYTDDDEEIKIERDLGKLHLRDIIANTVEHNWLDFSMHAKEDGFFYIFPNKNENIGENYMIRLTRTIRQHTNDSWLAKELREIATERDSGPFRSDWDIEALRFGVTNTVGSGVGAIHPEHELFGKTVQIRLSHVGPADIQGGTVTVSLTAVITSDPYTDHFSDLIHLNISDVRENLTGRPLQETTRLDMRVVEDWERDF